MNKYERLVAMNDSWLADRPIMDENNTIPKLLQLLKAEVDEAIEADDEELIPELADIGIFLFSLFRQLDADLYDAMAEKHAYNLLRYDWKLFQDGDYDEARKKVKQREPEIKKLFYSE